MTWLAAFLMIGIAYLIGAIPFGFLVARWRGINIFEHGSHNIGATNVGRVLGRKFGLLVFALDFAKGAVPVALALLVKPHFEEPPWPDGFVEVACGLTTFLGHLFPIYLRFHGGKGVATGAGAVTVLLPIPALVALFVWLIVACGTRYVSLASILAVIVLCVAQLRMSQAWDDPRTLFCLLAGGLVIVRHHANIVRLFKGTENQMKETTLMYQASKSLHVLALGMWFGMSVFFTFVVAFSLFHTFETLGKQEPRPSWFPRPEMYSNATADVNGPAEQGTRAFGNAIGPLFFWYFILQGVCGFVALTTALPWMKPLETPRAPTWHVHTWRVHLLLAAMAFVLIGWPVEQHVNTLRDPRNETTETYLQDRSNETNANEMKKARTEFGQWHGYSVLLNLATIVCVTGAMALAGHLPTRSAPSTPAETPVSS